MAEVIVVGAGPAGLVAALTLARWDFQVRVLERFEEPGGLPEGRPTVDVTPMEPRALGEFLGIDLDPVVVPTEGLTLHFYGSRVDFSTDDLKLHCVERGSRPSAIDDYLYRLCADAGVSFEFDHFVMRKRDFDDLPSGTIVATGVYRETYEALGVPGENLTGFYAAGKGLGGYNCNVWMGPYALDYSYSCSMGDIATVLYFNRGRVVESELEDFRKKHLLPDVGVDYDCWFYYEGMVSTLKSDNARLFWGNKVLAGTLSGMQEPAFLFGLHGALVSGYIAALAQRDRVRAQELFSWATRRFGFNMFMKNLRLRQPEWLERKLGARLVNPLVRMVENTPLKYSLMLESIPGWGIWDYADRI